ncbi:MAG: helix-turn-helix transcriptional regulator [Solirubrobacterales bacterium]|nr:helix-turn-helix transcriptional regulator [Solirubrobacterales bacterium]
MKLTPFSYVILVLVGRGGAGPHDLRRMAEIGRVYWSAAPSQWYAEPKRLLEAGLLTAEKQPGRTRERTHYALTDAGREALASWVRTPAALPRMQHESIVRLLAADLVAPAAVLEGLRAMRPELEEALAHVGGQAEAADRLPARAPLLELNARYAQRLLEAQLAWLDEAEALLGAPARPS